MSLSILKYVQNLEKNNLDDFQTVINSIQERLDWYDEREPSSNGTVFDTWQEKRDDTENLLDELQSLYDDLDDDPENFTQDIIKQIQELINDYQQYTGGLKRWF